MHFLPLLGKQLKDDAVVEVLEYHDIEVIYEFDRLHENLPDEYWAAAKSDGFLLNFDADQTLQVIFLYASSIEEFSPVDRNDCDIQFFPSLSEVELYAAQRGVRSTKGKRELLEIWRDWVRLEYERYSVHYEFRNGELALVTIALLEPGKH